MDKYGYPEEDELEKIRTWDYKNGFNSLMEYAKSIWHYEEYFEKVDNEEEYNWYIHTVGWSGNEDIIEALKQNIMFWAFCWVESHVGGHYKFKVQ